MTNQNPQVKITRTIDGTVLEGTCLASALPTWVAQGWSVAEEDKPVV